MDNQIFIGENVKNLASVEIYTKKPFDSSISANQVGN